MPQFVGYAISADNSVPLRRKTYSLSLTQGLVGIATRYGWTVQG